MDAYNGIDSLLVRYRPLVPSSEPWELLWDQVERWYGDVNKTETKDEFLARMRSMFVLTPPSDSPNPED